MATKQWLDFPHAECPVCGTSVQIETDAPQTTPAYDPEEFPDRGWLPPFAYCGDRWRCSDGHEGTIYCDSETPIQLEGGD